MIPFEGLWKAELGNLNLRLSFFNWVQRLELQTFYPAMLRYQNILFRLLRTPVHFCCREAGYFPFIIYAGNGEIITTKKVGRFSPLTISLHYITGTPVHLVQGHDNPPIQARSVAFRIDGIIRTCTPLHCFSYENLYY